MQWCSWVLYLNIFLTAINYCAKYGLTWYNIFLSCVSSSKVHNLLSLEVHKVAIRIISFRQKGKWNRREVLPCWRGGFEKRFSHTFIRYGFIIYSVVLLSLLLLSVCITTCFRSVLAIFLVFVVVSYLLAPTYLELLIL